MTKFIRHFDFADRLLAVEEDLQSWRPVTHAALPRDRSLDEGFFIHSPSLLFVVATPVGPMMVWQGRRMVLSPATQIDLQGDGPQRQMIIAQKDAKWVVPAPEPLAVDVNDPDDQERVDFYFWVRNRIRLPHVQERYRTAS